MFFFTADISKTLGQKKKRVEQFTQNSLKNTTKKVEDMWNTQYQARWEIEFRFYLLYMDNFNIAVCQHLSLVRFPFSITAKKIFF